VSGTPPPPPVPVWAAQGYVGLRAFLLVAYGAFIAVGGWAIASSVRGGGGPAPGLGLGMGAAVAGVGLVFAAAVAASFRLPVRPWAWSYHLAVICLGITLCVSAPVAAVLLWSWLAPEVRRHFGVATQD
jgi:hypothetical protein